MHERYRSFLGSIAITFSGLTIADFNAYLGCLSLILGIGYQIWKWHRAWVAAKTNDTSANRQHRPEGHD